LLHRENVWSRPQEPLTRWLSEKREKKQNKKMRERRKRREEMR
jgi:hypothetical protein